jgi:hypothetical protein
MLVKKDFAWPQGCAGNGYQKALHRLIAEQALRNTFVSMLKKSMRNFVAYHNSKRCFVLRNRQQTGVHHYFTTRHAPGDSLHCPAPGCIPT